VQRILPFLDLPLPPNPWHQLDSAARAAALERLARLIAQALDALPAKDKADD
jgi:hypothetical protein